MDDISTFSFDPYSLKFTDAHLEHCYAISHNARLHRARAGLSATNAVAILVLLVTHSYYPTWVVGLLSAALFTSIAPLISFMVAFRRQITYSLFLVILMFQLFALILASPFRKPSEAVPSEELLIILLLMAVSLLELLLFRHMVFLCTTMVVVYGVYAVGSFHTHFLFVVFFGVMGTIQAIGCHIRESRDRTTFAMSERIQRLCTHVLQLNLEACEKLLEKAPNEQPIEMSINAVVQLLQKMSCWLPAAFPYLTDVIPSNKVDPDSPAMMSAPSSPASHHGSSAGNKLWLLKREQRHQELVLAMANMNGSCQSFSIKADTVIDLDDTTSQWELNRSVANIPGPSRCDVSVMAVRICFGLNGRGTSATKGSACNPESVQRVDQAFIGVALAAVNECGGIPIQFGGGVMLAVWNAFQPQRGHCFWACRAALSIIERFPAALSHLSESDQAVVRGPCQAAVGTGAAIVGHTGTSQHRVPVVYGEVVDMTLALLDLNPLLGSRCLAFQEVYAEVGSKFDMLLVDWVSLPKLRAEHTQVYEVIQQRIDQEEDEKWAALQQLYYQGVSAFASHQYSQCVADLTQFLTRAIDQNAIPMSCPAVQASAASKRSHQLQYLQSMFSPVNGVKEEMPATGLPIYISIRQAIRILRLSLYSGSIANFQPKSHYRTAGWRDLESEAREVKIPEVINKWELENLVRQISCQLESPQVSFLMVPENVHATQEPPAAEDPHVCMHHTRRRSCNGKADSVVGGPSCVFLADCASESLTAAKENMPVDSTCTCPGAPAPPMHIAKQNCMELGKRRLPKRPFGLRVQVDDDRANWSQAASPLLNRHIGVAPFIKTFQATSLPCSSPLGRAPTLSPSHIHPPPTPHQLGMQASTIRHCFSRETSVKTFPFASPEPSPKRLYHVAPRQPEVARPMSGEPIVNGDAHCSTPDAHSSLLDAVRHSMLAVLADAPEHEPVPVPMKEVLYPLVPATDETHGSPLKKEKSTWFADVYCNSMGSSMAQSTCSDGEASRPKSQLHQSIKSVLSCYTSYASLAEGQRSAKDMFTDTNGNFWHASDVVLGRGNFGTVYLGMGEKGNMVAIKHIEVPVEEEARESVMDEIKLLQDIRHPNIVAYLGSVVQNMMLILVMEYVSCGSLAYILKHFGRLSASSVAHYSRAILEGLAYLHSNNILHRDIKPENVLIDEAGRCKLADFGTAGFVSALDEAVKGTPMYMAPEAVSGKPSQASDIWSFGASVFELLAGHQLWEMYIQENSNPFYLMELITREVELPDMPPDTNGAAQLFTFTCLQRDPAERPTAQELLEHPYLASYE